MQADGPAVAPTSTAPTALEQAVKHILVAFDGSESAARAFAFGLALAEKFGAALQVLAVVRPPELPEDVETEAIIESAREDYQQQFGALQAQAAKSGVKAGFSVALGHPAEQIVHYAETHGVDHIVLGHRGKTFFRRWLIGSVSKQVMYYAHCTTTVVR
jgi:nucleotide-binding universal stress UspA family protein